MLLFTGRARRAEEVVVPDIGGKNLPIPSCGKKGKIGRIEAGGDGAAIRKGTEGGARKDPAQNSEAQLLMISVAVPENFPPAFSL